MSEYRCEDHCHVSVVVVLVTFAIAAVIASSILCFNCGYAEGRLQGARATQGEGQVLDAAKAFGKVIENNR